MMDEHSISVENFVEGLKDQYRMYQNASQNGDLNSKLMALQTIRILFNQLRAGGSLFVSDDFLNTPAPYYLLKLEGN